MLTLTLLLVASASAQPGRPSFDRAADEAIDGRDVRIRTPSSSATLVAEGR
jgi:hypothetical protein